MRIENVTIVTRDDSVVELTKEELENFKGNVVIHEKQLEAELQFPEAWGPSPGVTKIHDG